MRILVSNVGSSSYKFRLFEMEGERLLAEGGVERIGNPPSRYSYRSAAWRTEGVLEAPDHLAAIHHVMAFLTDSAEGPPVLRSIGELDGVGFKAVFAKGYLTSAVVDEGVIAGLEAYIPILPVHNPAYIAAIRAFQELAPGVPLVAVFETWFHQTLPPYAQELGVPRSWVREHGIRRYGFHGASHRWISQRAPELLEAIGRLRVPREELRLISCHLGGSSSLCAIRGGRSVDTTMAFSTQSGLLQGTRCGDLDPFVPLYMMEVGGLSLQAVQQALQKDAGLAGISGVGGDMRDIWEAARKGNPDAQLALDTFHYGVKKWIGAYAAALGGVDAIAFTGGIGERGAENRAAILEGLEFLGVRLDPERNAQLRGEGAIHREDSTVALLVIPANEEIIVARETARRVQELTAQAG